MTRASDSVREPGFESCAATPNVYCYGSFSCMNKYLAIDSGACLCRNGLLALIAAWADTSQRSQDCVQVNGSDCAGNKV